MSNSGPRTFPDRHRGISLDIYDGESIAIVGESGSGQVRIHQDLCQYAGFQWLCGQRQNHLQRPDLAEVTLDVGHKEDVRMTSIRLKLDAYSKLEHGADTYKAMKALEAEKKAKSSISDEEDETFQEKLADLRLSGPRPSTTSRPWIPTRRTR